MANTPFSKEEVTALLAERPLPQPRSTCTECGKAVAWTAGVGWLHATPALRHRTTCLGCDRTFDMAEPPSYCPFCGAGSGWLQAAHVAVPARDLSEAVAQANRFREEDQRGDG